MSARIIDFPDGYTNAAAPVFGSGIGDGSLQPEQEQPSGTVDGINDTFTLAYTPFTEKATLVFVDGIQRDKDTHWNLVGDDIVFEPSFIPTIGQEIKAYYFRATPAIAPSSASIKTEFRTITGPEATAKQLTLVETPSMANETALDFIGVGPQFYGIDYTVSGTTLSWSGLSLDGLLLAGDRVRINYGY
jgi:hypothetical protein